MRSMARSPLRRAPSETASANGPCIRFTQSGPVLRVEECGRGRCAERVGDARELGGLPAYMTQHRDQQESVRVPADRDESAYRYHRREGRRSSPVRARSACRPPPSHASLRPLRPRCTGCSSTRRLRSSLIAVQVSRNGDVVSAFATTRAAKSEHCHQDDGRNSRGLVIR